MSKFTTILHSQRKEAEMSMNIKIIDFMFWENEYILMQIWQYPTFIYYKDEVYSTLLSWKSLNNLSEEKYTEYLKVELRWTTMYSTKDRFWYIYIIKCSWKYKIGKTINIEDRKKKYITENPCEIEVVHFFETKEYSKKEKEIHKMFEHKNIHWEWFELDDNDIIFLKSL